MVVSNKLFDKKKSGQSLVEFGLILALVCLLGVTVMQHLGESIKSSFTGLTGKMQNANERSQSAW